MTDEFQRAVQRVIHDIKLDRGRGADLIAVGVQRDDCLSFLEKMVENEPEPVTAEFLSMLVQWSVAIGVWLERERWQPTEGTP